MNGANIILALFLLGVLIALMSSLYALITATNKKLADFLMNIKYDDYEAHYSSIKGEQSQKDLSSAFNLITGKFRDIRQQKEAQFHYLKAIVENVDTGLICFDDSEKTILINRGLQQLLHKSYFRDLNHIKNFNVSLFEALKEIVPGEKKLVKLMVANQIIQLSIGKTILKLPDESLHLYALQNIHAELERQEVASWQKLIRILTHEILNSITPVISLAEMTNEMIQSSPQMEGNDHNDIKRSIETIERRSKGLLDFTETYRKLTKVPLPKFELSDPCQIIERVLNLFSSRIKESDVKLSKHYPANPISVLLDPNLMEQVFINLVKNALEAMANTKEPLLTIAVTKDLAGTIDIAISDNGPGISEEDISSVFVPFFTTKEEGSGIGLSLSRQIVHMHKGNIFATSEEGLGTCFTIQI